MLSRPLFLGDTFRPMHFFDIAVLAVATIVVGLGIRRGFISEVFRLAAVVVGFVAAVLFYDMVYARLGFVAVPLSVKTTLSFLLVYVAVALCVLVVGWLVRKIVHLTLLGWLDRLLGGLVGLIKVAVLAWILILCITVVPGSRFHDTLAPSLTYRMLTRLPLRLKTPSLRKQFPSLKSVVDVEEGMEKIRKTKQKVAEFKVKVDSAKAHADSFRLLDD